MDITKDRFIEVMRCIHNGLYRLHKPNNNDEFLIIRDLINNLIAVLCNYNPALIHTLTVFLLNDSEFKEDDVGDLYDALIEPPTDKQRLN